MKIFEAIARRIVEAGTKARRSFSGGVIDRLTSSFIGTNETADSLLQRGLSTMRARARSLAINNDYVKRYIQLNAINIIGPNGMIYQSMVKDPNGKPDATANKILEDGWYDWARIVGFKEKEDIFIKTVARDGEILVRFIRGKAAKNKYNFDIQLLEADHLDETFTDTARNIRMGIQYNDAGDILGYWIWENHPGGQLIARSNQRIFISASEMRLIYFRERPSQTRGYPWIHSAIIRLNNISAYEEAEIYAARLGASKMGFITTDPEDKPLIGDQVSAAGEPEISAEPGTFSFLNPGQDIKFFDPNHPAGNFDPFIKAQLRGAAAGLDVSYASLSADYSDVNYSSLRQAALYERDQWMIKQTWASRWFHEPIFAEWLSMFLTTGLSNLPLFKFDKFNAPQFFGRRWTWVDPVKDITALKMEIELRIKTRTRICNENGYDFNDIAEELSKEEQLLKEKGLAAAAPQKSSGKEGEA